MFKENLIKNIHKDYRLDPWINELYKSSGLSLDDFNIAMLDLKAQYDFDTLTWSLPLYEKLLKIKSNTSLSNADRGSFISAKWKMSGKSDLQLLQSVANSWKNGEIKVEFIGGVIKLTFNGEYGVPTDLATLIIALNEVKPAHLPLTYIYRYLLIKDINNVMTLNQLQATKLNKFAGGA